MITNLLVLSNGVPIFNYDLVTKKHDVSHRSVLEGGIIEALVNFSYEISEKGLNDFGIGDKFYKISKVGSFLISILSDKLDFGPSEYDLVYAINEFVIDKKPTMRGAFPSEIEESLISMLQSYIAERDKIEQQNFYMAAVRHGSSMQMLHQFPNELNTAEYIELQNDLSSFINLPANSVKNYGYIHLQTSNSLLLFFKLLEGDENSIYIFTEIDYFEFEGTFYYHKLLYYEARDIFHSYYSSEEDIYNLIRKTVDNLNYSIIRWIRVKEKILPDQTDEVFTPEYPELVDKLVKIYPLLTDYVISLQDIVIIAKEDQVDDIYNLLSFVFPQLVISKGNDLTAQINIVSDVREFSGNVDRTFNLKGEVDDVAKNHYITEKYLQFIPDLNHYRLLELNNSIFTWFISKVYTYLLVGPAQRLNIENIFSVDDRLAIPIIIRTINNLKPSYKEVLAENLHFKLSLKKIKSRFAVSNLIPLNNQGDEHFLIAYLASLPEKYRSTRHAFLIALPSSRVGYTMIWEKDKETYMISVIFEEAFELSNVISHRHLLTSAINEFIYAYDQSSNVAEKTINTFINQITNLFTLESIDLEFSGMDKFLEEYNEFMPNILTALYNGMPVAITPDYQFARILIDMLVFSTHTLNATKDKEPMYPHRLTFISADEIEAYEELGYLVLNSEVKEVKFRGSSKFVDQVWSDIGKEQEFTDKLYMLREFSTNHYENLSTILNRYSEGLVGNELYEGILDKYQRQFLSDLLAKINPHIENKSVRELDPDQLFW